ncbi:MAG TPA: hypothetical protein VFT58_03475 [Nitrososphaera sp.]|nr:hypothetical protein [Nitrososphaera sp.]
MIATLWALLRSKLAGWLAAAGVALGILFAAYNKGRQDSAARQGQRRLEEANKARKVEHEVDGLSGDAVRDSLGRWMRDK